jgi:hypothetical protein
LLLVIWTEPASSLTAISYSSRNYCTGALDRSCSVASTSAAGSFTPDIRLKTDDYTVLMVANAMLRLETKTAPRVLPGAEDYKK